MAPYVRSCTQFSSPSSCSNKHKSLLLFHITKHGYAGFRISPHWRTPARMTCFMRGRASATTLARETFMPQRERCRENMADVSRSQPSGCSNSLASGSTLRTLLPVSRSIDPSQLSKPTLLAFWRGFSIFANPSIPVPAGKRFGNTQRVFFQNPAYEPSILRCLILARLFASRGTRDAISARSTRFAGHKVRLHCLSENRDPRRRNSSRLTH